MTLLAAEHITVTRGGKTILRDVSVQAHAGEFIAVLGPNGAGKSTLLKVLAGLLKPDAGQVMLDAHTLARTPNLAQLRAYLPQNPQLEWPISVERLVALGLTPHLPATGGLPRNFAEPITRALEQCDLPAKRDQAATTLSGGEFARAMLARAIVGAPKILIVDEPITGSRSASRHGVHAASVRYRAQRNAGYRLAARPDFGGPALQPLHSACGWSDDSGHRFAHRGTYPQGLRRSCPFDRTGRFAGVHTFVPKRKMTSV